MTTIVKIRHRFLHLLFNQVGGELFSVQRSTLTSIFPDSYLANLFSGRWEQSIERDQQGNYFLDMDPGSFALILTYLRYEHAL